MTFKTKKIACAVSMAAAISFGALATVNPVYAQNVAVAPSAEVERRIARLESSIEALEGRITSLRALQASGSLGASQSASVDNIVNFFERKIAEFRDELVSLQGQGTPSPVVVPAEEPDEVEEEQVEEEPAAQPQAEAEPEQQTSEADARLIRRLETSIPILEERIDGLEQRQSRASSDQRKARIQNVIDRLQARIDSFREQLAGLRS